MKSLSLPLIFPTATNKRHALAAAWLCLGLTACSTVPTGSPKADAPAAPTPQVAPAPQPTAGGPLSPVTGSTGAASAGVLPLVAPRDIWERIRRGYSMPNLEGDLVRDREQWYRTRPDYIQRMTERSRKYLYHIVEELERRQMPSELALLPFIESAFNPQAVSSARAAGMWQFIPSTGKHFALKQNIFRDDRRDVLASTRAALDYLQRLYGMFGDWHLALAAYNWGEGNVQRAIAKNQKLGLGTGYLDLNMPVETRQYVPKLQAVKNIVSNGDEDNSILPDIPNHPYFQSVSIAKDIDVTLAAKLAGVSLDDFRALNPSAHKPVILAAGTPQILLPWENAIVFQQNLEAHGAGRQATWTAVVLDKTGKVADIARHYGMSEAEFRQINNIPPRMLLKAGSTVMVARGSQRTSEVSQQVADNAQIALTPEMVLRRMSVRAKKGDTPASIASRHHVTAANVMKWNGVGAAKKFKPGQAVTVYLLVPATAAHPTSDTPREVHAEAPSAKAGMAKGNAKAKATGRAVVVKGPVVKAGSHKATPTRAAATAAKAKSGNTSKRKA